MATLYEDILQIARSYMGIAAKDYIDRRCRIVTGGGKAEGITVDKLDRLITGIDMTAKVYMGEEKATAFKREITALLSKHS